MKRLEAIRIGHLTLLATLAAGAVIAVGQTESTTPQPQKKAAQKATQTAKPDRGQQVFEQNCARCHNAPQGFPPSISGTIAMHMRVRAGLSDADYKALRQFLNP